MPSLRSRKLAEEIGWHIGDGSMNSYLNKGNLKGLYSLRGHIKDDLSHYQQRVIPAYSHLFNINIHLNKMPSYGVCGFQVWSDDLIKFKTKLGLPLGKKTHIEIPKFILIDRSLYSSFVRGFFDTDGCLYLEHKNKRLYPRIQISNVSSNLMNSLWQILNDLGFRATIYTEKVNRYNWNNKTVVVLRGHEQVKKWFKIIKPGNPKHNNKYYFYLNKSS